MCMCIPFLWSVMAPRSPCDLTAISLRSPPHTSPFITRADPCSVLRSVLAPHRAASGAYTKLPMLLLFVVLFFFTPVSFRLR